MKIKVCGMGSVENIEAVAALQPDYLGFIFFEKSARNFNGTLPIISPEIIKTGVFVNASFEFIQEKVKDLGLKAVQLHGSENPEFCEAVKNLNVEVFKVFSIKGNFDFSALAPFEGKLDYFLFDTKGELPGGNGYTFDWEVLKQYNSKTPFILSGGIGLEEIEKVKEIIKTDLPIHALDINSKFEIAPASKDVAKLKEFFKEFK
ncbi:phosphoribosylanthranilate isomerase [Flavicella sediminum]|uniref:phosphoribosylanthranilate isomerase n=1 Tax=Flavicella sediminum TaxID=2585141 RepID=UPI00140BA136|nr:phosphoribosylanthranilate isomerase [Flavicella sediminum]